MTKKLGSILDEISSILSSEEEPDVSQEKIESLRKGLHTVQKRLKDLDTNMVYALAKTGGGGGGGAYTDAEAVAAVEAAGISIATTKLLAFDDGGSVDIIRDEDNMVSDDEDALATQQSIKAYIDGEILARRYTERASTAWDFNHGDLGGNDAWQVDDLNFAAIIPAGAIAAIFLIQYGSSGGAGQLLAVRTSAVDNYTGYQRYTWTTLAVHEPFIMQIDSDRKIDVYHATGIDTFNIVCKGWFI